MICKNIQCRIEFEPTNHSQKYCCVTCQTWQKSRNAYHKNPEKAKAANVIYKLAHPDKVKKYAEKRVRKNYLSGKLPKWMFT